MTGYHVLLRRPKEGEETLIVCVSEMGNTATADTDTGTDLDTKLKPRWDVHTVVGIGMRVTREPLCS